ncbi:MAG: metallophosphoesterase family protein [Sulfitobacter sp.]|nr:metallophosphoesterase family protein [Sulfitobacter sp.]
MGGRASAKLEAVISPTSGVEIRPGLLGIVTDLHGNPLAVEAVIRDGQSIGVTQWIVLGDVVALGPDPIGVLRLLDQLDVAVTIAGNTERRVLTGYRPSPAITDVDPSQFGTLVDLAGSFGWTKGLLTGAGRLSDLHSYVGASECTLPDGTILLAVHASLVSDEGTGITPDGDEKVLTELFYEACAEFVVGGHTHQATDRRVGSRRLLNPGSVSNPHGPDKSARYLVIRCSPADQAIEFRSVSYDVAAVRQQIEQSGDPGTDYLLSAYFD